MSSSSASYRRTPKGPVMPLASSAHAASVSSRGGASASSASAMEPAAGPTSCGCAAGGCVRCSSSPRRALRARERCMFFLCALDIAVDSATNGCCIAFAPALPPAKSAPGSMAAVASISLFDGLLLVCSSSHESWRRGEKGLLAWVLAAGCLHALAECWAGAAGDIVGGVQGRGGCCCAVGEQSATLPLGLQTMRFSGAGASRSDGSDGHGLFPACPQHAQLKPPMSSFARAIEPMPSE
mmetsp:Transcript_15054/g.34532  ORF Transcript_15054/g.34532 Transcript_15054/m.34532 type:complete len:239 (-) Transcript_15054:520-1236(-)